MRAALDHLGRHGRWLGWGPTRHGVGGNIASYVRIVEEECFVELYCDMEQLEAEHEPRRWPDDRFSSNTWGPLPPRSYFRFDDAAVESERESLEMLALEPAAGLHDPAHDDRAREPRAAAAVALRRRLPRRRLLGRPRRVRRAAAARAGPAPGRRPLRRGVRRLAVVQRGRRRADRPDPLALPRVLHRRERAARRRGGHDLPVHLGRPGLRARARLDPGLPEEARLDLDDAHVRARRPGRPRD